MRPHLLALPLLAASLLLLERQRRRGGWAGLASLALVQVLWVNLHGSFPEGIALAGLFGAGEALRRRWTTEDRGPRAPLRGFLLLPPLLLGASLINPYGWRLVRLAFTHPVDPLFRARIYEYLPPFGAAFRDTRLFLLYSGWLALFLLALWTGRRRLDPAHLLPAAAFLGLSLWMNRAIADFVVVSLRWVAVALSPALLRLPAAARRGKPVVAAALLAVVAAGTLAFGYRFDAHAVRRFGVGVEAFTPAASADYLERTGFRGNILCSFPHGAYLAYRLSPQVRVVFDSRTIPYGTALYREYGRARGSLEGFREHLARYPVDAVHLGFRLDGDPRLHEFLRSSGDWGLVYFDDQVVLYLRRTPRNAAVLERDRLRCASPVRFGQVGVPPGEAACWERDCARLLERRPGSMLPRFLLAAALKAQGRVEEALGETDRILASGPGRPFVHRLRAELFAEMGDEAAAQGERARAGQGGP